MLSKKFSVFALTLLLAGTAALCHAQEPSSTDQQQLPAQQDQRQSRRGQRDTSGQLVGKITSMKSGSLDLTKDDGTTVAVKLTEKTEFRKDRQPAKMGDFKIGDMVFLRGDQNQDQTVSASLVAGRTGNGRAGGPGARGFGGA